MLSITIQGRLISFVGHLKAWPHHACAGFAHNGTTFVLFSHVDVFSEATFKDARIHQKREPAVRALYIMF
jgi:hypothetical protein